MARTSQSLSWTRRACLVRHSVEGRAMLWIACRAFPADGHTSQMLTTSIFAISTLISSHQIYNLLGHVQEDNLQQLALFSAYGKCVQEQQSELEEAEGLAAATPSAGPQRPPPPFQRVELLVRDSPRITTFMPKAGAGGLWPVGTDPSWAPVDAECERQLESILSRGANADLVSVRAQIKDCFAEVSLAMLPNPGCVVLLVCLCSICVRASHCTTLLHRTEWQLSKTRSTLASCTKFVPSSAPSCNGVWS